MTTSLLRPAVFLSLLMLPLRSQEKEPTLAEAKAAFTKADAALNKVWETAKVELSPTRFAWLREQQRDWVEYRDHLATSPGYSGIAPDSADPKNTPGYFSSAAALTESRTKWLRGMLNKTPSESLTGAWSDSYGGHVEIVEREGKLYFNFNCVRGPTAHLGALAGVASWNETIGWFSDKGRDESRKDETNIAFVMDGNTLEIHGANTGQYHGARAYFDGDYVKTGNLDAKLSAKVVQAAKSGEPVESE